VIEDGDPLLAEMLRKLLAKKPDDRFQSAAELMAMLDAVSGALATRGVVHDFGLRGRGGHKAARMLRRIVRHLPRAAVARLSGGRVAIVLGLLLASTIAAVVLALGSSAESNTRAPGPSSSNTAVRGAPVRGAPPASAPRVPPKTTAPRKPGTAPTKE
jgi:hypothetical protein